MKSRAKKLLSLILCIILMITFSLPAFADNNNRNFNFKDVKEGYWAYDQIKWMFERNIIVGVGNDLFRPDDVVTRAQFAKMMVLTLNLQLAYPDTPSFLDISRSAWEFPYVEGAKYYLTGFRTTGGDYFKSSQTAVREDMAVALVKALGYQNESVDESVLNKFADAGQISANLRKYIALSVKHNLVEGYTQNGQTIFSPQGTLTRAQASTLLYKAFKSSEDKVTYEDGTKVTYDDQSYSKPSVSVSSESSKLTVSWNRIDSSNLAGYVVVISKNDSSPVYPENGYLYYITDRNRTSAVIDNSTAYTGNSDFGKYLEKDKKYYISVSAVYKDRIVAGNAVRKTYPGSYSPEAYLAPAVYSTLDKGKLLIKWNKLDSAHFKGYAVVISKNDPTPQFPDNGYLYYITDKNMTSATIDNRSAYVGNSDFGQYLTKGQKYYFSVTAAYDDRYVPGNTFEYIYPGNGDEYLYPAPVVSISEENGNLVLRWNRNASEEFAEYRVVVSKGTPSPKYPDNGYLYSITDRDRTYAVINNGEKYNGGDFGNYLTKGEKYYFSVTAVYKDRKVAGNAVQAQYKGTDNPELFQIPVVSAAYEGGKLIIKWDKIDSPQLLEYRLVISQKDSTPSYPGNGFYGSSLDKNTTSAAIDASKSYVNGDFIKLTEGVEYYFTVTAVYSNKLVTGNVLKVLYVLPPKQ